MLHRELITTADGSPSLYIPEWNESYHSRHGAANESRHVFINNGIKKVNAEEVKILELGWGTGLNFLLTLEYLQNLPLQKVAYFGIEKYPLTKEELSALNLHAQYPEISLDGNFDEIYQSSFEKTITVSERVTLRNFAVDFFDLENLDIPKVDLVYFDCFGARVQPELWEKEFIQILKQKIKYGGLLTTYASKGSFRRGLETEGFSVTKIPGPSGKREMVNAIYVSDEK